MLNLDTELYQCFCGKPAQFRREQGLFREEFCHEHLKTHRQEGDVITPLVSNVRLKHEEIPIQAAETVPADALPMAEGEMETVAALKPPSLDEFIGQPLTIDGERVIVTHICGSAVRECCFQINGTHLIVILDAYKQLWENRGEETGITQEMIDGFAETAVEKIFKVGTPTAPKEVH